MAGNKSGNLTAAELRQKRAARRTHNIDAVQLHGESALIDPLRVDRLSELRRMVKTEPGRQEIRREMAARLALIADMATAEMVRVAKDEKLSLWDSSVIKRGGTWFAELRRLLDSFPPDDEMRTVAEIIYEDMANGKENG